MIKKTTIPRFSTVYKDKELLDNVQLALYVTICKLLAPELEKIRKRERKR